MSTRRQKRKIETARARGVRRAKRLVGADAGCAVCQWKPPLVSGYKGTGLHGHHVIPVAKGGPCDESNVIVLCPNHHSVAHAIGEAAYALSSGFCLAGVARRRLLWWLRLGDTNPTELLSRVESRRAALHVQRRKSHDSSHGLSVSA